MLCNKRVRDVGFTCTFVGKCAPRKTQMNPHSGALC